MWKYNLVADTPSPTAIFPQFLQLNVPHDDSEIFDEAFEIDVPIIVYSLGAEPFLSEDLDGESPLQNPPLELTKR